MGRNALAPERLEAALERQDRTGARLGEVATANGWTGAEELAAALAEQRGLDHVDLCAQPPQRGLNAHLDLADALRLRAMPWRRTGRTLTYVTSDPDAALPLLDDPDARIAVIGEPAFQAALREGYGAEIAARALGRTPDALSVRSLDNARQIAVTAMLAAAAASVMAADTLMAVLAVVMLVTGAATTATRLAALVLSRADRPKPAADDRTLVLADHMPPPIVSLLIPLYREAEVLPRLIAGLERLDYPRDRLDVKLLLEADDWETRAALAATALPRWIETIAVPPGGPRTKPRALNVALDFCRGEVVGVLDAEDRPDPDQLQVVTEHFRRTPHKVAAVQCQLAYFNARENWITRCFQIEYSIWFDVLLRGWQRLGLPIPLGGTSVYFRRKALDDLGGWDAHNVTEDADLGMRIARAGLVCDVVGSTTEEEANCRITPWIRQRSRWLKGYMMTWLCHMRRPRQLWRELGPAGFLGFQVLLLGGAISYLAMPLFWLSVVVSVASGASIWGDALPGWALAGLAVVLAAGQAVMLAAAALALRRRRSLGLVWWVPTLLVYWTMGAVAAWKAIAELGVAPYFWDKTRHGVTRMSPDGGG